MQRYNFPNNDLIVGFGNRVVQALCLNVEAVAEQYGGDGSVEEVGSALRKGSVSIMKLLGHFEANRLERLLSTEFDHATGGQRQREYREGSGQIKFDNYVFVAEVL